MPFVVIARFTAKAGMESALRDEAALMAHAQTPHVVRARAERVDLLDGPHDVSRCNVVA